MKNLYLKVEQGEIDCGTPSDGTYCPIALATWRAIERAGGEALSVHAGTETVEVQYVMGGKSWTDEYHVSRSARRFMRIFDRFGTAAPQNFRLNIASRIAH